MWHSAPPPPHYLEQSGPGEEGRGSEPPSLRRKAQGGSGGRGLGEELGWAQKDPRQRLCKPGGQNGGEGAGPFWLKTSSLGIRG